MILRTIDLSPNVRLHPTCVIQNIIFFVHIDSIGCTPENCSCAKISLAAAAAGPFGSISTLMNVEVSIHLILFYSTLFYFILFDTLLLYSILLY